MIQINERELRNHKLKNIERTRDVRCSFSRNSETHEIELTIDFNGVSVLQIVEWAVRERVKSFHNSLRYFENEKDFNDFMEAGDKLSLHAFEMDNLFTSDDTLMKEAEQLLTSLSNRKEEIMEILKEKHKT